MPNKTFLTAMGIGLVVMGAFVGWIVYRQQGVMPRLVGSITSVRTLGMDEASSVAIVDFQVANDSKIPFIVNDHEMTVVDAKGETKTGRIISAADTKELFQLFPAIGARNSEILVMKTNISPSESRTGTLAARFEIPKAALDTRQKLTISIHELDGPISQLTR